MYETTNPTRLEAETLDRMREVFAGRVCETCGTAAVRLHGEQFFCASHLPNKPAGGRSPRVYRCHYRGAAGR